MSSRLHLLGIRHHGPGSARSVIAALDELVPDVVAVELPADTQPLLGWVTSGLVPPVALLGHVIGQPSRASFLPFAEFSPEWQALRWAAHHGRQIAAIDLPLCNLLAWHDRHDEAPTLDLDVATASGDESLDRPPDWPDRDASDRDASWPDDPLAALAHAAGEPDVERWWDDMVEHRGEGLAAFHALADAIGAIRAARPDGAAGPAYAIARLDAVREAFMRRELRRLARAVLPDGGEPPVIAVVCGAWHVPALREPWPEQRLDTAALRGMPKVKVGLSWVPWSHRRLARDSGYGAGVASPGWYAHLFAHPGDAGRTRWFVDAARLLRDRKLQASPDHLIAASRAAVSLAALRGRPAPGLDEVLDAADAVMAGSGGLLLIIDELVIGEAIGAVPPDAPQVPLAADINAHIRRLRLKPQSQSSVELDLRTSSGRARSVFLHRLGVLGIHWGTLTQGRGSSGTFRETWELRWRAEFSIQVVEAAAYGTTLDVAAAAALSEAVDAAHLPADLIVALERALLAGLDSVVAPAVHKLSEAATVNADVHQVIDALGPLARTVRYGDVRGTPADTLRATLNGLVVRVVAGAEEACRGLDDDLAAAMVERLSAAQSALALVEHPARHEEWPALLARIAERRDVHGMIAGRSTRLLHDEGAWDTDRVRQALSRALSVGVEPKRGADFVEGFLAGSGTLLVHDRALLDLVDQWLCVLHDDEFRSTVALLRRTFGGFEPAERRRLGQMVGGGAVVLQPAEHPDLDPHRLALAMATVRAMEGLRPLADAVDAEHRAGLAGARP